jgi:hypothetical protein
VPADHGVWLDDHQDVRPARPEPGEHEPEGAVGLVEAWASRRAPRVGQLLAKGEVLQGKIRTRAAGRAQCAKDPEKQGRHRAMMHDGWPPRPDSRLIVVTVGEGASRMTIWRGTVRYSDGSDGLLRR